MFVFIMMNVGVMLGSFPVFCRVLAAVDGADPLQLFLCLPPPPG